MSAVVAPASVLRPVPAVPGGHAVSVTVWTVAGVTAAAAAAVVLGAPLPRWAWHTLPTATFVALWMVVAVRTRGFVGRPARRGLALAAAVVAILGLTGLDGRGPLMALGVGLVVVGLRRRDAYLLVAGAVEWWASPQLVSSLPAWAEYGTAARLVTLPRMLMAELVLALVALGVMAYRREVLRVYAPPAPPGE